MLKKISRLTKDKEFEKVFKQGKSAHNNLFSIKTLTNNLLYNRFGIIVSLKVHKKATERNKAKRRIREALKVFDKKIKASQDIVVVCRPNLVNADYEQIKRFLNLTLKRLKLINDN